MRLITKIAEMLFGTPERDETVAVQLVYEPIGGQGYYTVSFVIDGELYLWRFVDDYKQIVLTKVLIGQGASAGYYSWDQAIFARQLIDAATR